MELRERIKTARKALGLSQEALARRADVSLSLINQIERGVVVDPHYSTLVSVAEALSMSVGELLGDPVPLGDAPQEGEAGPTTEQGPLDNLEISEADRRCLLDILDPLTAKMQSLLDTYGPHIRLLSTDPPRANTSPDDPPPKKLSETFAGLRRFHIACAHVEDVVDGLASSKAVSPWLARMNDEAIPANTRKKLHDFETAREELFDNLVKFAEAWMDANRKFLPDEGLAKLNAEEGYLPGELAKLRRDRS